MVMITIALSLSLQAGFMQLVREAGLFIPMSLGALRDDYYPGLD